MTEGNELMAAARQKADERIDRALGALRRAAVEIANEHGIPENIAGHSQAELLGRMAWVPSMARDLRRACGQQLAQQEIERAMAGEVPAPSAPKPPPAPAQPPPIDPSKIPDSVPVGLDLHDLSGVTVQTIRALKQHGFKTVGDVVVVPDAHLAKYKGLGEKSVAQVRAAIAKASQGGAT